MIPQCGHPRPVRDPVSPKSPPAHSLRAPDRSSHPAVLLPIARFRHCPPPLWASGINRERLVPPTLGRGACLPDPPTRSRELIPSAPVGSRLPRRPLSLAGCLPLEAPDFSLASSASRNPPGREEVTSRTIGPAGIHPSLRTWTPPAKPGCGPSPCQYCVHESPSRSPGSDVPSSTPVGLWAQSGTTHCSSFWAAVHAFLDPQRAPGTSPVCACRSKSVPLPAVLRGTFRRQSPETWLRDRALGLVRPKGHPLQRAISFAHPPTLSPCSWDLRALGLASGLASEFVKLANWIDLSKSSPEA